MDSNRIKGAARDFGGRIEDGYGRATGDDESRAEGLARQAAGRSQALYGQAKDGLQDIADRATDYAGQVYDQGSRYAAEGSRALNSRVETNPLMAILVAGALGYVLGLAARRR